MSTTKGTLFAHKESLKIRGELIHLSSPKVMGILNITPDSFVESSRHSDVSEVLKCAEKMLKEGAEFLDVGAYSTRPGAADVSMEEEWSRLALVLSPLRAEFGSAFISIDTFRAEIAERALNEGADLINDISGGSDPDMFPLIAKHNCPYILMHMQGTPQTMQANPVYEDVVREVAHFFSQKTTDLKRHGVSDILLDVGFGFGKTLEHNYTLLNELKHFDFLGYPMLIGVSRKSMITKVLGISSKDALNGTSVLNTMALERGAKILRVHDVKEAYEAVQLFKALRAD